MNNHDYVNLSLELHLFFDRIMKEHSFFIEAAFTDRDKSLKKVAHEFQNRFTEILKNVIYLADGNVSNEFLMSNEIATKNTIDAEIKTNYLTGSEIDSDLTKKELTLSTGERNISEEMIYKISNINKQTLPVIKNLIEFKKDILNNVLSCKMYTTNYPLLITHIMNEAKMYYNLLNKIESRTLLTKSEVYEQEIFWSNIMKEHAEFIRGLLDPAEEELIETANKYAQEYKDIIRNYSKDPSYLVNATLNETLKFRDFKIVGEEGILNCKVKSIIVPLLADHVVREANHFIRILKKY